MQEDDLGNFTQAEWTKFIAKRMIKLFFNGLLLATVNAALQIIIIWKWNQNV